MLTKTRSHQIRTESEGMMCDHSRYGCRNFATYAIVPEGDPDTIDHVCDDHHDRDERGAHINLQPIDPDIAALHARFTGWTR